MKITLHKKDVQRELEMTYCDNSISGDVVILSYQLNEACYIEVEISREAYVIIRKENA